jgi:hypothetical protein
MQRPAWLQVFCRGVPSAHRNAVCAVSARSTRGALQETPHPQPPGSAGPQFTETYISTSCSSYPGNAIVFFNAAANGFGLPISLPIEFISTVTGIEGTFSPGDGNWEFTCNNRFM